MPRPTPAQFAYGSVTTIGSALAMLLLSQARSGPWLAVIALAATVLGVFVALSAPGFRLIRRTPAAHRVSAQRGARPAAPGAANSAPAAHTSQLSGSATGSSGSAGTRMAEPSR